MEGGLAASRRNSPIDQLSLVQFVMPKDRTRWLAMLPFLTLLCTPAQAGKHDPIYIPEPIYVPAGVSAAIIRDAIRKALFDEEFIARDIAPGQIEGKRIKSGAYDTYFAMVRIDYDNKILHIRYQDSENLYYDAKKKTIHSTYNRWVRNVERRVRQYVGASYESN